MTTHLIRDDIQKAVSRIQWLRDEVKVRLHLASLDAKQEWDEKLSPRIFEVEQIAKHITEGTREAAHELVEKLEAFLGHLRKAERHPREHTPRPSSRS
jgi:hypothetical protein